MADSHSVYDSFVEAETPAGASKPEPDGAQRARLCWAFFTPMRNWLSELAHLSVPLRASPLSLHVHGRFQRVGEPLRNEVVLHANRTPDNVPTTILVSTAWDETIKDFTFLVQPYSYAQGTGTLRVRPRTFIMAQELVLRWLAQVVDPEWDPETPREQSQGFSAYD